MSLTEKHSVNLEITRKENFLRSMNNHYPWFSDISMPMNYHESIVHHDLCGVAMSGVLFERNFVFR